jgi:hypothetical protein
MQKNFVLTIISLLLSLAALAQDASIYNEVKKSLNKGWNTWNTRSVLSHVLLPEGLAVNLGFKQTHHNNEKFLHEALIGRHEKGAEAIFPGPHTMNGSYTELELEWQGINVKVQSAHAEDDLVILITPQKLNELPAFLVVETAFLWNKSGCIKSSPAGYIEATTPSEKIPVYVSGNQVEMYNFPIHTPYLTVGLNETQYISTGKKRTLEEVKEIITNGAATYQEEASQYGEMADIYTATQSAMAWNTIYDPINERVLSTVNRIWNVKRGGYVTFGWDNFFGSFLSSFSGRDWAYVNFIEALNEKVEEGFVSNNSQGNGRKAWDRSQPPVGSIMAMEIYGKFEDEWFLEYIFDDLLTWNRWWTKRRLHEGMLSWGSHTAKNPFNDPAQNSTLGGALESGMDDSPMYEEVPFNSEKNVMELHDVGLNSLYVADCNALAEMATILGRKNETKELKKRASEFSKKINSLWHEEKGIYVNKRTDTKEFYNRLSPTSFYPLLAKAASNTQAERLIKEHFYNPEEFWGEWILPSIARNDPAYPTQRYWKGAIWAPMNFLVYLGLRNYPLDKARKDLVNKSAELFLKEWRRKGYVSENYSAITGTGDADHIKSEHYYFWGGLLGIMSLMEIE